MDGWWWWWWWWWRWWWYVVCLTDKFLIACSGSYTRLWWASLVWGSISAPNISWDPQQDLTVKTQNSGSGGSPKLCNLLCLHLLSALALALNTTYMLMTSRFVSLVMTFPLSSRHIIHPVDSILKKTNPKSFLVRVQVVISLVLFQFLNWTLSLCVLHFFRFCDKYFLNYTFSSNCFSHFSRFWHVVLSFYHFFINLWII